jgi:hypothetical protein
MPRILLCMAMIAALSACNAQRDAASEADNPAPAADQPAADVPPATMPVPASMPMPASTAMPAPTGGADAQASFSGYGEVKFGTPAADMEQAWGGELNTLGKDAKPQCYFMTPKWAKTPAEFALMIGDGKFARYSSDSAKQVAPGGGRVGMDKAAIGKLYAKIDAQPHKYTDGEYLRIGDPAGGLAVLVFETDNKGDAAKVTGWRVGVPPQVDFVEGCS